MYEVAGVDCWRIMAAITTSMLCIRGEGRFTGSSQVHL